MSTWLSMCYARAGSRAVQSMRSVRRASRPGQDGTTGEAARIEAEVAPMTGQARAGQVRVETAGDRHTTGEGGPHVPATAAAAAEVMVGSAPRIPLLQATVEAIIRLARVVPICGVRPIWQ